MSNCDIKLECPITKKILKDMIKSNLATKHQLETYGLKPSVVEDLIILETERKELREALSEIKEIEYWSDQWREAVERS